MADVPDDDDEVDGVRADGTSRSTPSRSPPRQEINFNTSRGSCQGVNTFEQYIHTISRRRSFSSAARSDSIGGFDTCDRSERGDEAEADGYRRFQVREDEEAEGQG